MESHELPDLVFGLREKTAGAFLHSWIVLAGV
jgi:hypothetical protein